MRGCSGGRSCWLLPRVRHKEGECRGGLSVLGEVVNLARVYSVVLALTELTGNGMKGPVATVELWEKGRCVFSHGVSKGLLQAAVDENCFLLLVGGDGAPELGKHAVVPLENLLKRLRSQGGLQLASEQSAEDRSPYVRLGWVIALFEWACKDFPLAEIRYIHNPGFKLPERSVGLE